jgi:hypothetical protein
MILDKFEYGNRRYRIEPPIEVPDVAEHLAYRGLGGIVALCMMETALSATLNPSAEYVEVVLDLVTGSQIAINTLETPSVSPADDLAHIRSMMPEKTITPID